MFKIKNIIFLFCILLFSSFGLIAQETTTTLTHNDVATGGAVTGVIAVGYSIWRFIQKYVPLIQELADANSKTRQELNDIKSQIINLKKGNN